MYSRSPRSILYRSILCLFAAILWHSNGNASRPGFGLSREMDLPLEATVKLAFQLRAAFQTLTPSNGCTPIAPRGRVDLTAKAKRRTELLLKKTNAYTSEIPWDPNSPWNAEIWQARSNRPLPSLSELKVNLTDEQKVDVLRSNSMHGQFELHYSESEKKLGFEQIFRKDQGKPAPAFQVQRLMIQHLADSKKNHVEIKTLQQAHINNEETLVALESDFINEKTQIKDGFENLKFLKSKNGKNILDFISEVSQDPNPYRWIQRIQYDRSGPGVTIELDQALLVHPIEP